MLPVDPLVHCLVHTASKVVFLDDERARTMRGAIIRRLPSAVLVVLDNPVLHFDPAIQDIPPDIINPEDNATIIFTSGGSLFYPAY